jgi:hypothetical protein
MTTLRHVMKVVTLLVGALGVGLLTTVLASVIFGSILYLFLTFREYLESLR